MPLNQQLKSLERPRKSEMTRTERIIAHYVQGMKLSASDEEHRQLCEAAHGFAHAGRNRLQAAKMLVEKHGVKKSRAYQVINDAEELYGNIGKSNRDGLEYLVIEWLKKIARKCMKEGNYELAIMAIDKMGKYGRLGEKKSTVNIKNLLMPQQLVFSDDPEALKIQMEMDTEDAEHEEVE